MWGKTGSLLYGRKSGADYIDNQKRFLLFCKAALQALHVLPFSPGDNSVVVCNDWHTSMLPVLLKVRSQHCALLVYWRGVILHISCIKVLSPTEVAVA